MKYSNIVLLAAFSPAFASLFFQESKADRIKNNLKSIGYEVLDSAGLVKDSVIESFDPESLKDWLEAHGVVDAASHTLETAKQHKDWLLEDISDFATSNTEFASALLNKGKEYYTEKSEEVSDSIFNTWSDSKIKEFLDARGVAVPQGSTRNEINALAARVKHSLPVNVNGPAGHYWFDGWSREELSQKLQEAGESIEGSRKELIDRIYKVYSKSYESGKEEGEKIAENVNEKFDEIKEEGERVASEASDRISEFNHQAGNAISGAFAQWKEATKDTFSSWSLEDLKEYISEFGSEVSDAKDKLVEKARYNYYYFIKGEVPPQTTFEKIKASFSNAKTGITGQLRKLIGINAFFHNEL